MMSTTVLASRANTWRVWLRSAVALAVASLGLVWPSPSRATNAYVGDLSSANVFQFAGGAGGSLTALTPASVSDCAASHQGTGGVVLSPDGKSVYAFCGGNSIEQYDVGSGGTLSPKSPATVSPAGGGGNAPWGRNTAQSLAISPNGQNVYSVGTSGDNNVYQLTVGAGGQLSAMSPAKVAAGQGPTAVVVSPDGAHVYVTSGGFPFGPGSVSGYDVGAGGALTPDAGASVSVEGNANTLAISPDGSSLYVAGNAPTGSDVDFLDQFSVNPSTGALTAKSPRTLTPPAAGGCGQGGSALAVSPDGHNVYLGTIEDASGGSCTGSNAATTEIVHYTVGSGGTLTQAGVTNTGGLIGDIAISSDGANLFASESSNSTPGSDDLKAFTIAADGSLSGGTTYTGWTDPGSIALTPSQPEEALTVSKAGSGSGTVTSADGGINCGSSCSDSYAQGTTVTLTATPAAGSTFAGWSGGGCSGTGTCVVTMSSTQSVTATFNTQASPSVSLGGSPKSTATGVSDKIKCSAPAGQSCQITETLTTIETTRGGKPVAVTAAGKKKKKKVVVGSKTVTIRAGQTATVTIRLNPAGLKLLKRFGKLPVTLTIKLNRSGKLVTVASRKVTIKQHKKKHHSRTAGVLLL